MECKEARQRILAGETATEELRRHLEACTPCAALAEDDGALARLLGGSAPAEPPPGLLAAVRQDQARERGLAGRLRALATPARAALALLGGVIIVGVGLLKLRPDLDVYPLPRLLLELGALGLMGLGAGWLWLRPLHRPTPPRWLAPVLLLLALLLPWVLSALPAAHVAHPAALEGAGEDLVRRALACFIYGSLLGLPLVLLTALLGRGARRMVRLAVLPAAAGALAGLLSLHLHCPLTSPLHLLAGHAPIVLAAVLVSAVVYRLARRP